MFSDIGPQLIFIAMLLGICWHAASRIRDRILFRRMLAERSELMRRIACHDDYDTLLFRIERVEMALHYEALRRGYDPDLYITPIFEKS